MRLKLIGFTTLFTISGFFLIPSSALAQDPLIVANVRVSAVDDRSAIIEWTTNFAASGRVEYGASAAYGQSYGFQGESRASHSITLPNLRADTKYHFRVISTTAMEEAKSFDQTFTTSKAIDRDTPIVTDVAIPYQTANVVVIQWRTNEPSDSLVLFGPNTRYGRQAGDSARVTIHDVTITGLQPLTTYHFQVKSKDEGGNVGISSNYTFRTASDSYSRPSLELANVRPVAANDPNITDTSAMISWRTTTLTDGTVRWGTTDGLGRTVAAPSPRDFFHSVKLDNLQPATTYYFQVESRDVFGVSVRSPIFTLVTKGGYSTDNPYSGSFSTPTYASGYDGRVLGTNTSADVRFYTSFNRTFDADFSVGNPTPQVTGNPTITTNQSGIRGEAATFQPSDVVKYSGQGNFSLAQGSVSFWLKTTWDSTGTALFSVDPERFTTNNIGFNIVKFGDLVTGRDYPDRLPAFQELSQSLAFFLKDGAGGGRAYHVYIPSAYLTDSGWQFITITWQYDGGTARLYYNGSREHTRTKIDSTNVSGDVRLGTAPSHLGMTFSIGTTGHDGKIDEFTIFNTPLSDAEVQSIYTDGLSRYLPNLIKTTSPKETTPSTGQVLGTSTLQYTTATALLKAKGQPDVYAIMNGQKHLISGPSSFAAYGYRWSNVRVVSPDALNKYPDARLVRTPADHTIYYLYLRPQREWLKLGIPSPTVFVSYPNNFWGNIITINEIDMSSYPDARLIKNHDQPTVYVLHEGTKREITADAVFDELNLPRSNIVVVNDIHLNAYPNGEPLTPLQLDTPILNGSLGLQ